MERALDLNVSCTVLVVEDQPPQRALLVDALNLAGYAVREAWNGDEAIAALERSFTTEQPISLIILDMKLPYRNGVDVLGHLATRAVYLPVIAMSANDEMLTEAISKGAHSALPKPFDLDDLLAAVRRLCPLSAS